MFEDGLGCTRDPGSSASSLTASCDDAAVSVEPPSAPLLHWNPSSSALASSAVSSADDERSLSMEQQATAACYDHDDQGVLVLTGVPQAHVSPTAHCNYIVYADVLMIHQTKQ